MDVDMEKITKIVAEKSEITIEQARKAITVLMEQFKEKLPEVEVALKKAVPDFDRLLKEPLAAVKR